MKVVEHLNDDQLAAVVAGLEIDASGQRHLSQCLICRRAVRATEDLIAARREQLFAEAPDFQRQREQILAEVARHPVVPAQQRSWSAQMLLAAAAAIMAVAVGGVWMFGARSDGDLQTPPLTSRSSPFVAEDVLAEVDAVLAEEEIPGFAPLHGLIPDEQELELLLAEES